jgi:hypothetical protein
MKTRAAKKTQAAPKARAATRTRGFVIAGVVASAAIVAAAVVLNVLPGAAPASHTSAGSTSTATPGTVPPGKAGTEKSDSTALPAAPKDPGKRVTTEVLPPTATATIPTLPPSTPAPALYSGPLPDGAHASGTLVAGFPENVTVIPGSRIGTSSVSSDSGRMQATLTATTSRSAGDVTSYYTTSLGRFGLASSTLPAAGGSTALGFNRDGSSVTLTVTPTKDGARYVLLCTLTPSS